MSLSIRYQWNRCAKEATSQKFLTKSHFAQNKQFFAQVLVCSFSLHNKRFFCYGHFNTTKCYKHFKLPFIHLCKPYKAYTSS